MNSFKEMIDKNKNEYKSMLDKATESIENFIEKFYKTLPIIKSEEALIFIKN